MSKEKIKSLYYHFLAAYRQCTYLAADQKCEFCEKFGYPCHKIWGPKRNGLSQDSASALHARISPSRSSIPFVSDPSLSVKELSCLHLLVKNYARSEFEGCHPVVLQNIWQFFGFTFTNSSLLYGLFLASEPRYFPTITFSEKLGYISRFERSIVKAISQHKIGEIHLLGTYFILVNSTGALLTTSRLQTHLQGFMAQLSHLIRTREAGAPTSLLLPFCRLATLPLMRLGKQGVDLLCRLEHFEKHFAEPLALDVPSSLTRLRGQNSTWIGLCTPGSIC